MITEDYVSYDVAKLLKEKGFDWDCEYYYKPNGEIVRTFHIKGSHRINSSVLYEHQCLAPTHQMAMKWLRKIYGLHISVIPYLKEEGEVIGEVVWVWKIISIVTAAVIADSLGDDFNSCEEAVEADLKYCLTNLI